MDDEKQPINGDSIKQERETEDGDEVNNEISLAQAIKSEQNNDDVEDTSREDKSDDDKTNLIVNYLPQQMTDEQFEQLFKKFGEMKSCKIVRNRVSRFSYGFGFVDFATHEQALKAIQELNGYELENKKIKVAFARPAGQDIKQANLYIKNVPNNWTQEDVKKVFEPYGNIIQVRVLGNNRGVAFVLFDLRKQAEEALEALNGKKYEGCESPFEIKFAADKKSEKNKDGNQSSNQNNINNQNQSNNNHSNRSKTQGQGLGRNVRGRQNFNNMNNSNLDMNRRQRGTSFFDRQNERRDRRGQTSNNNQQNSIGDSGNFNQYNNGIGPVRQAPTGRMNRYAPFVPVQQQITQIQAPQTTAMAQITPNPAAFGYATQQQQMIPFSLMTGPGTMNPLQATMTATPNPIGMYGAAQIPMAYTSVPQNTINNIYSVASNNLTNAANMQPQLTQPISLNRSDVAGIGIGGLGSMNMNLNSSHNSNNNNFNANSNSAGDGCTLFVYNIGPDSDEKELRSMFAPYGSVIKCNVVRKTPGGETKGFGFVTLKDRDQATAAIAGLDGSMRNGRALQVSLKK